MAGTRQILVTGGGGQLGTELQRVAWPEGYEVVAIDVAELDLRDTAAIRAMVASRPWAAVVSAGAYTAVDKAESDQVAAWVINALAPAAFGAACATAGIRIVQVSTDYVFAGDAEAATGTFHFSNAGLTTWAGFAREIFAQSTARGRPGASVEGIPTSVYPTPARRPANSLLDQAAIRAAYGIEPRPWQAALSDILDDLIGARQ